MKYLVFAGNQSYPNGGWNDLVGSFGTYEEAITAIANLSCDWWHIVEVESEIYRICGSGTRNYKSSERSEL